MEITGIGYVFIFLGIFALFFNRDFLYSLLIFFLPFTATAVININSETGGTAIQPYMFFAGLWIISLPFNKNVKVKLSKYTGEKKSINCLLLFILVAFFSLFVPMFINGSELGNQSGKLDQINPIIFTNKNYTQFLYLLLGAVFSICICIYNNKKAIIIKTIRIYILSVIFVMFWGVVELICDFLKIKYPDFIFNNSANDSALGYLATLGDDGIKRISSVSVEASVLVQSVCIVLPFFLLSSIYKVKIFNKKYDHLISIILILFILRCTSATGIIMLITSLAACFLVYLKQSSVKQRVIAILLTTIAGVVIIVVSLTIFKDITDKLILGKSETYSGLERLGAIYSAWENFLHFPLLGVGWGSVTSFDLVVKILSNTGVLGLFFFVLFIFNVTRTYLNFTSINVLDRYINNCVMISFLSLIVAAFISGFLFVFGFWWLIVGLMIKDKRQFMTVL